jgi:hypothetical protein
MLSKILWLSGSSVFFLLGSLHLYYTFFTHKLDPRDESTVDKMKNTSLRLTRETTAWKAWTGFNASHSAGGIFIGFINGILAIQNFSILENSFLLSFCTIVTSIFYLWLAKKYWFSTPFFGLLVATSCFIISPVVSFFS